MLVRSQERETFNCAKIIEKSGHLDKNPYSPTVCCDIEKQKYKYIFSYWFRTTPQAQICNKEMR